MNDNLASTLKATWDTYTESWKADTRQAKRILFESSLDSDCEYSDQLAQTEGWDALLDYMLDFHQQVPGGHFQTDYFLAHHNKSIARWQMKNGNNETLGEGISYGEYNSQGKLVSMTGFFEPPAS